MNAYIKEGIVVGIYTTEPYAPKDCEIVKLSGRTDLPLLGWLYDSKEDKFTQPERELPPELAIEDAIAAALDLIDMEAAVVYASVVGTMPNKLAIYTAKYQDAKAFKLQVYGDKFENYKWIASEVSATGKKAEEISEMFIAKFLEMMQVLTKVEELRIYGKAMLRSSSKIEEVREARSLTITEIRKFAV